MKNSKIILVMKEKNMNIEINKKDDVILKLLHYFITKEDYKPVIINGIQNEIWLENMEKDLKLIRLNTNYIHNEEQLNNDTDKAVNIMHSIKRNTLSFRMTMLNILLDTGESIDIKDDIKNVETIKIDKLSDFKQNKFVAEFFPQIEKAELNDKADPLLFFKLTEDMNNKTMKQEKKLARIFSPKKPYGTYALISINIVIFIIMLFYYNDVVGMFANNYTLVQSGQWYRILTCMFLHADIMHIVFNMYALYILGTQVERYYGTKRFLIIYLLSGLLGSLFSCVFMSANTISLGASGAIFGLLGSIAYFTYNYRASLQGLLHSQIIPVILINLLIGFTSSSIDVSAHIGGLIGGILASMAIGLGDKSRKSDQINGSVVLLIMYAVMIYFTIIK